METMKNVNQYIGTDPKIQNKKLNTEDPVIIDLLKKMKSINNIKNIIFYGSRARGDQRDNSDYDIILILDKRDKTSRQIVSEICVQILEERNAFISVIIYSKEEWNKSLHFPFGINVQKEGIELWKEVA